MRFGTVAAGAVVFGSALALAHGSIDGMAIGDINTLTVNPTHGQASASFTATYSISSCLVGTATTVEFSWNAVAPKGPVLGTAMTNAQCAAHLLPPSGTMPGITRSGDS